VSAAAAGRLAGRRITVGVTGSIAAYKAAVVVRLLLREGARVTVVMTTGAARFVGASTFAGLTGEPVLTDMFDASTGGERHVELAAASELVLVVPATADFLARLATGRADDLLAATALSARCPVIAVPAMHPAMWSNAATQRNVAALARDGHVELAGPVDGEVASGERGMGRMLEPDEILARVALCLGPRDLAGRHLVVTAGPTVEDIDPVRFVGNRSSGKMGFALAEQAALRGARVTLVAGPVSLATPRGVDRLDVRSALDMRAAVREALGPGLGAADALLMCAAVGDYRPEHALPAKLKRGKRGDLTLKLVQNPDILAEVGRARKKRTPLLVGFAVETGTDEELVRYAREKLHGKRVDVVVANHAAESMGREDNRVLVVGERTVDAPGLLPKRAVADRVLDWVAAHLVEKRQPARRSARPRSQRSRR
jgi:phosphopantothenoylcysteine decarboxylase/phosphopantothenate--cysteine ligase